MSHKRRHHNTKGYRCTKRDKRQAEVERMARKILGKKLKKRGDK